MRLILPDAAERGRILDFGPWSSRHGDGPNGAFEIPGPCGRILRVIADDGTSPESQGWEHVSVSLSNRPPNWAEMCFVKDLFWREDEWVVQYHPAKSDYVNYHPHCLHLWRCRSGAFPTPPSYLVGPATEAKA